MSPSRRIEVYCAGIGAVDACTGVLLAVAPLLTLRLMAIPILPQEPVYMRWIGAFVFAAGAIYLYPFLATGPIPRAVRFRVVLEATCWIRASVALFVTAAMAAGALAPAWISVGASDAALAAAQIWLLRQGGARHADA